MAYEREGISYRWKRGMLAARRRRYVEFVPSGANFAAAAHGRLLRVKRDGGR